jgi:hypothetical protein
MGMTQQAVAKVLQPNADFRFVVKLGQFDEIKDETARLDACEAENRAYADHATDFEVPLYNVWKQR